MYLLYVLVLVVYFWYIFFDNLILNLINDFILIFDGFILIMIRKLSVNFSYSIKSLEIR